MPKKLPSLSLFFPFYNDQDTVQLMIEEAFKYGLSVAEKIEVIAIHGGASKDKTWQEILRAKRRYPDLKVVNKADNKQGYAVIQHGFQAAVNDWVFYTDGDGQYPLKSLVKLVACQRHTQANVVNGFKIVRQDSVVRKCLGKTFERLYKVFVRPPISDIHCDFRLIEKKYLDKITWQTTGANIISELILKMQRQGAVFAEVPVNHVSRKYGKSNYTWMKLCLESCQELIWSLKYTYLSRHTL